MSSRRVTSEQVDDVLLWTGPYADPTIQNICRDWLDMAVREADCARYHRALQRIRDHHGGVCEDFLDCDHVACRASVSAWFESDRALNPATYEGEAEPVLTARSWLRACRDMDAREARLETVVAAARRLLYLSDFRQSLSDDGFDRYEQTKREYDNAIAALDAEGRGGEP